MPQKNGLKVKRIEERPFRNFSLFLAQPCTGRVSGARDTDKNGGNQLHNVSFHRILPKIRMPTPWRIKIPAVRIRSGFLLAEPLRPDCIIPGSIENCFSAGSVVRAFGPITRVLRAQRLLDGSKRTAKNVRGGSSVLI